MVDIGYKQEGLVSVKEFQNLMDLSKIEEGDDIEVYLEKLESSMGNLVLSKDKAEILHAWDRISEACEKGIPIEGTVVAKVKGGLSVDIGVKAFLPGSQIDLRPTRFLDKYIGKSLNLKLLNSTRSEETLFFLEEQSYKKKEENYVLKSLTKSKKE